MTPSQNSPLKTALSGVQLRRSLIVMVVVGTALSLINQGDVLFAVAPLNMPKIFLTYCLPFLVVSFGAWSALQKDIKSKGS
ncbi:MAG: hypothetical protein ABJG88_08620 [Litorimonas sp.]